MFYEELYTELGRLFYRIAAVDGKVTDAEKEALQQLIESRWKPLESSTDAFGTDKGYMISFAFDYEEAEKNSGNGIADFESFYRQNEEKFTPAIIDNILTTAKEITSAFRSQNKAEHEILVKLTGLFDK